MISLHEANTALSAICGITFTDRLEQIKTMNDADRLRKEVLDNYSYNAFSHAGVHQLGTVLHYIAHVVEQIEEG